MFVHVSLHVCVTVSPCLCVRVLCIRICVRVCVCACVCVCMCVHPFVSPRTRVYRQTADVVLITVSVVLFTAGCPHQEHFGVDDFT